MKHKEKKRTFENFCQQDQEPQISVCIEKQGQTIKECTESASSLKMRPADQSINCKFNRFLSNGNQPLNQESMCLDVPIYSENSSRPSNLDNTSNYHVGTGTSSFAAIDNSAFRRNPLCSVSSDPEVYTKTPSIEKLNCQIRKLRGDMLALRTTTVSHKEHMEKLFNELKTIAFMHDNMPCQEDISESRQPIIAEQAHFQPKSPRVSCNDYDQKKIVNGSSEACNASNDTVLSARPFGKPKAHQPKAHHPRLPSYEDVLEARLSPNNRAKFHPVISSPDNSVRKGERPYSDPFVTGATRQAETQSHPQIPVKYSIKSADSSLETGSKRSRGTNDQLRLFAVMSKPETALHISECSIDSGYQDSFITSPKDKLGLELSSHVVTPTLIGDLPLKSATHGMSGRHGKTNHSTKQSDSIDPCTNNESSKLIENAKVFVKNKEQQYLPNSSDDFHNPAKPNKVKYAENSGASPPTHPVKAKCIEENHASVDKAWEQSEILSSKCNTSSKSDDNAPLRRPIPKQRTVFATAKNQTMFAGAAERPTELKIPKLKPAILEIESSRNSSNFSSNSNADTKNNSDTPISTRSFLPHCLTVIKPSPLQTPIDIGSPLQSRVKLGVSAIKQLTPGNEKSPGFYCPSALSQQANDANSRSRKTANTKQMLRDKYAAAVEQSSSAAAKPKTEEVEDESEWSMVRRRSMRMMTEFQIVDFKDGTNAKKAAAHRRHGGRMIALQKQKQRPGSPTHSKASVSNKPNTSYRVPPSVTQVSKQVDIHKPSTSQSNVEISLPRTNKEPQATYAGEPLPPPPPSPPRTPQDKEDSCSIPCSFTTSDTNRTSSIDRSLKNIEIEAKQLVLAAPLVRPKASLPEAHSDENSAMQTTTFNGLKLYPNSKSAFKPIFNPSNSEHQEPLDSYNKPSRPPLQNQDSTPTEPQRRQSLPQNALTNKQRFLNEFMPDMVKRYSSDSLPKNEAEPVVAPFQRHASWRKPRRKIDPSESSTSEKSTEKSDYKTDEKNEQTSVPSSSSGFTTTEPLFCQLPKANSSSHQDGKRRRHASASKVKMSSVTSPNHSSSLENQPVQFDKSDKITDVIGALKTAGYLRTSELGQSFSKAPHSSSSFGRHEKSSEDNTKSLAPATQKQRMHQATEPKGHIQTCYKARSSTSLHQYETVKLIDDSRINSSNNHKTRKHGSKDVLNDEPSKAPRSHKSTIALIRASLLGRRDKGSRSSTADGKRDLAVAGQKVRSSSVGDKLKVNDEFVFEFKQSSKSKNKEHKLKKNKTDSKTKDKNANKNNPKIQKKEKGKLAPEPSNEPYELPGASRAGHGNPDAEVMERFLAAAAAAASNTPRSPLQRLRSSFRTPKHKNRLQESRIRDDMDMITKNCSVDLRIRNKSNVHNGQEFTYV